MLLLSATITTSGSSFAADNKSIQVTMQVTTQPIAQPSTSHIVVRLAQGAPVSTADITLTNVGQETLQVQGAKTSGAAWITATPYSLGGLILDFARVTIEPKGLSPRTYSDAVAIASNAVGRSEDDTS